MGLVALQTGSQVLRSGSPAWLQYRDVAACQVVTIFHLRCVIRHVPAGCYYNNFERLYRTYPENWRIPRTFTVIFGNADEAAMEAIAELTGGRAFDGTSGDLSFIFKQIRGYQ